jgi:class 3 adenylate cyclase
VGPLSGVVTFLFTDIEGSTRRWEADAEAMRAALAVRNFYDSGQVAYIRGPLATLAVFLDRVGRLEPAATMAGFALSPYTASTVPELTTTITHLREVLGDPAYESLARKGEAMTTAAMVAYAYDQIDQARKELNAASK